jgi:two-component system KDP operon response regulator KdpE
MTVLLLDFDQASLRSEAAALRFGGYDVAPVSTIELALRALRMRQLEAAVVDPAWSNAAQIVRQLRQRTAIPIIVVSSAPDEIDVVSMLDAGADDYLSKPFGVEELLARIRAALRRTHRSEGEQTIVTEGFVIDVAARRYFRTDGSEIRLTGVERHILEILLRRPGHVVETTRLLEEIWGAEGAHKLHNLRVYVARIRRKLEPDSAHPRYLLTARGLGLVFDVRQTPGAR